jgi:hypothetical protein
MMSMQKEEKIAVVLLLMALGSLSVAFWAFYPDEGMTNRAATLEKDASSLEEGLILGIKPTKNGGNLLLSIDTTSMPIFIPYSAGAKEVERRVHVGDRVRVRGIVSVFQGKEELKVSKASDVQLI